MSRLAATLTGEQVRANYGALVKRAILSASEQCDPTWRAVVAATLAISRQRVDQMLALDTDVHVNARDLLAFPEPIRHAVAQLAIGEGYDVVALPVATETADDWSLVAAAQRESAEAVGALIQAIADGRITASEGATLERECEEAIAALLGVRERARVAKRERVLGLRAVRS